MKYQQLENLECGWKWQYLIKKWKDGEAITCHVDRSEADAAVAKLKALEHEPTLVLDWIDEHMPQPQILGAKLYINSAPKQINYA